MAADNLIHATRWHNGKKTYSPLSDSEMKRRSDAMQARMDAAGIDACLFTSYHNICYFSGFLYRKFGRRLRRGAERRGRHHRLGGDRRRPAMAAVGRRQRHLHRLAARQLFHRAEGPSEGEAPRRRVRRGQPRPEGASRRAFPRRRACRLRGVGDGAAHHQERRGTCPDPQAPIRRRRAGADGGGQGRRAGT